MPRDKKEGEKDMADYTNYTKQEMQAYAIAKNIKENQIVIVGTGLPLIGASLAKRAVCPSCHPIVESGLMDCAPVELHGTLRSAVAERPLRRLRDQRVDP